MSNQRTPVATPARTLVTGRGFTLIEVLVVVAIIALLISILLPSLSRAKEMSRRAVCASRLHNMGVAVHTYADANKGRIIEAFLGDTQVAIAPRRAAIGATVASGANPRDLVDWQGAAKRYYLDRTTWECPNRDGIFGYEGTPDVNVQGYSIEFARGQGYKVDPLAGEYDQWIIGYQYLGGIREWNTLLGTFPSRSPVDNNAKGTWALAAESNIKVDGRWGGGRPSAYRDMPPHPGRDGKPEGGMVLTFDGAATWHNRNKWLPIHSWRVADRECYWVQRDLGEYGEACRKQGLKRGIR